MAQQQRHLTSITRLHAFTTSISDGWTQRTPLVARPAQRETDQDGNDDQAASGATEKDAE